MFLSLLIPTKLTITKIHHLISSRFERSEHKKSQCAVWAAEDPKLGGALLSKEHTLYLSFLGPNNPSLSSPKFGSCL